jgi:hypothetical protein
MLGWHKRAGDDGMSSCCGRGRGTTWPRFRARMRSSRGSGRTRLQPTRRSRCRERAVLPECGGPARAFRGR